MFVCLFFTAVATIQQAAIGTRFVTHCKRERWVQHPSKQQIYQLFFLDLTDVVTVEPSALFLWCETRNVGLNLRGGRHFDTPGATTTGFNTAHEVQVFHQKKLWKNLFSLVRFIVSVTVLRAHHTSIPRLSRVFWFAPAQRLVSESKQAGREKSNSRSRLGSDRTIGRQRYRVRRVQCVLNSLTFSRV